METAVVVVDSPLSSRSRFPSASPQGSSGNIFAVGRGVEGKGVGWGGVVRMWGEKPRLVLCQSFKAQGDTLNNGAPVHTVSPYTAQTCTHALMYVHVYSKHTQCARDKSKRGNTFYQMRCLS